MTVIYPCETRRVESAAGFCVCLSDEVFGRHLGKTGFEI